MIDKLCQRKQWKQSIYVSTSELTPGFNRRIEARSHVVPACLLALLCFTLLRSVRLSVVGLLGFVRSRSELFNSGSSMGICAKGDSEEDTAGQTVANFLTFAYSSVRTYNASDRSAPPLRFASRSSALPPLCYSLYIPPSLSSIHPNLDAL